MPGSVKRFSFIVFIGKKKQYSVSLTEKETFCLSLALLFVRCINTYTNTYKNTQAGTHQILRTLADGSVLRGTVSGSVREREERERGPERKSVRRGEERGMEQFTNENGDYVKPQFYCIDKVRTHVRWLLNCMRMHCVWTFLEFSIACLLGRAGNL